MDMITLDLRPSLTLTDDQFAQICQHNRDLRFERTAQGELVIMAPTGGETGSRNLSLGSQLWQWNQTHKLGRAPRLIEYPGNCSLKKEHRETEMTLPSHCVSCVSNESISVALWLQLE